MNEWVAEVVVEITNVGIVKLVSRLTKCKELNGEYVQKYLYIYNIYSKLLVSINTNFSIVNDYFNLVFRTYFVAFILTIEVIKFYF